MESARASWQVIYYGRVQGVGFRMTARRLARSYPVAGHVRNLPDGTVKLLVMGDERAAQEFLDAIASAMDGYIERVEVEPAPPDQSIATFEIVG
jgi:acylphosphatase